MGVEHGSGFEPQPEAPEKQAEKIHWKDWRVAVFSAASAKDRYATENGEAIGQLLATDGFDAINGGYDAGGMKGLKNGFVAVCREQGMSDQEIEKHLSGVIFSDAAVGVKIKQLFGVISPAAVKETANLPDRAGGIINNADAYIATEGGIGTVIEFLLSAQNEWIKEAGEDHKKKPIIVVDKDQMVDQVLEVLEKTKPGSAANVSPDIYLISGHSAPTPDGLPMATLKNDWAMRDQVDKLLNYYYLLNLDQKTAEQDAEVLSLKHDLFSDDSPTRVLTLKERQEQKKVFDHGAGI